MKRGFNIKIVHFQEGSYSSDVKIMYNPPIGHEDKIKTFYSSDESVLLKNWLRGIRPDGKEIEFGNATYIKHNPR